MYVFLLHEFLSTQVPGQGCHSEAGTSGASATSSKIILKLKSYKEFDRPNIYYTAFLMDLSLAAVDSTKTCSMLC